MHEGNETGMAPKESMVARGLLQATLDGDGFWEEIM